MNAADDMMKLYSQRILALAADIPLTERLENPDATVRKRSPLCGSTVTVDIKTDGEKITEFGQDVKACALGQTSASILGANVIGRTEAEIQRGRDQLYAMLKGSKEVPDPPFQDLEVLLPAEKYNNRHASVLLAFDATLEALKSLHK